MDMEENEVQWMEESGTQMMAKLGVQPGHIVVDFGCGVGCYSIPLSKAVEKKGTVYAIERSNECLAELQKRALRFNAPDSLTVIQLNDMQLEPIPSGSADFFFAFDVLQYIDEWPLFFATVDRVLKPSGIIHLYPAEIPHPGKVNMVKLVDVLKTLGFEQVESKEYEMMHNKFHLKDRIYTFCHVE